MKVVTLLVVLALIVLSCQQKNTKPCEIPPDGIAVVPLTEMAKHDYCECESNGKWFRAESNGLCYAADAPQ